MVNAYKCIYIEPQYEHAISSTVLHHARRLSSKTQTHGGEAHNPEGSGIPRIQGRKFCIVFIPTLATGTIVVHESSIKAIIK